MKYSAFQKELHKIFTNFRLPFIKSRRSDRYLSDITFQSLRPELSFGVSFMFISGHFWSADTKQKKWTLFSRSIFSVTIDDIKILFAPLERSCNKLSDDIKIIKIEQSVATRHHIEILRKMNTISLIKVWPLKALWTLFTILSRRCPAVSSCPEH